MGISPVSCLAGLEGCSSESSAALAQSGVGGSEIPSFFSPVNPNWGGSGGAMPLKQRFELQNQLIAKPCCLLRAGSGAAHPPSVALLLRSDAKSVAIFLFTLMGALYQPLIDEKFLFLKQLHIIRYT